MGSRDFDIGFGIGFSWKDVISSVSDNAPQKLPRFYAPLPAAGGTVTSAQGIALTAEKTVARGTVAAHQIAIRATVSAGMAKGVAAGSASAGPFSPSGPASDLYWEQTHTQWRDEKSRFDLTLGTRADIGMVGPVGVSIGAAVGYQRRVEKYASASLDQAAGAFYAGTDNYTASSQSSLLTATPSVGIYAKLGRHALVRLSYDPSLAYQLGGKREASEATGWYWGTSRGPYHARTD